MADDDEIGELVPATPPLPRAELVAGTVPTPIIPRTIEEIWRFAEAVLLSGIAPDSYTKYKGNPLPREQQVARVVMGIQKGSEVGLPPLTALSTIGIINNIPCIYGDGISALIQNKGHLEWMKIEEIGPTPEAATETGRFSDDFGIRVTMKRKAQEEPYVGEFTVGDAKRARLWMDPHRQPWMQHPKRMLKWRAFHRPASDGFADDLMGLAIRELVEDMPSEPAKTDASFLDDTPPMPEDTSSAVPSKQAIPLIEIQYDLAGEPRWAATVQEIINALKALPTTAACTAFQAANQRTIQAISDDIEFQRLHEAFTSRLRELEEARV